MDEVLKDRNTGISELDITKHSPFLFLLYPASLPTSRACLRGPPILKDAERGLWGLHF